MHVEFLVGLGWNQRSCISGPLRVEITLLNGFDYERYNGTGQIARGTYGVKEGLLVLF